MPNSQETELRQKITRGNCSNQPFKTAEEACGNI